MLDKNDEKTIEKIVERVSVKVVGTALEEIVLSRFQKLGDDCKKHKEENKKQFEEVSEKLDDVIALSNRIESLVKSEIKYVDGLSGRVLELEKAHK